MCTFLCVKLCCSNVFRNLSLPDEEVEGSNQAKDNETFRVDQSSERDMIDASQIAIVYATDINP